jgi:hypothetical protein
MTNRNQPMADERQHDVIDPDNRCCAPLDCAYTPSRVRLILAVIRHLVQHGDDPGEAASSALGSKGDGRSPGASPGSDATRHAQLVWDVQRAQKALGGRASAEAISAWLCPFVADERGCQAGARLGEARPG